MWPQPVSWYRQGCAVCTAWKHLAVAHLRAGKTKDASEPKVNEQDVQKRGTQARVKSWLAVEKSQGNFARPKEESPVEHHQTFSLTVSSEENLKLQNYPPILMVLLRSSDLFPCTIPLGFLRWSCRS